MKATPRGATLAGVEPEHCWIDARTQAIILVIPIRGRPNIRVRPTVVIPIAGTCLEPVRLLSYSERFNGYIGRDPQSTSKLAFSGAALNITACKL